MVESSVTDQSGMTEIEQDLAEQVYDAIMRSSRYSERSLQAAQYRVGISDLGYCSERTRRMLAQQVPDDTDLLPAFIGTAIGHHVETALAAVWPDAIIQDEVYVDLHGDTGDYRIYGHPDVARPDGLVLDVKTARGLALPQRHGPNQQQQFQRHLYALGAHQCGWFPGVALEDVMVGNVWIDRAGDDRFVHVNAEPFSQEVVDSATEWLDEVVYAFLHEQEARKEPPREVCERTCGFYADCRMLDTDVQGLITNEEVLTAIDLYQQGMEMERQGRRLKDQSSKHLTGIQGSTGTHVLRWVHVGGSEVAYSRKPYDRLELRALKGQ